MKKLLKRLQRGIVGMYDTFSEEIPDLPSHADTIGQSVQGRDISAYRIGNGKRSVIFVASIHGNETGTTKLARHLITWLSEVVSDYPNLSFHIVPCLNPDGAALAHKHPDYLHDGRVGRFNGHGVDLNRNFDTPSFTTQSYWTHGKNYQEKTAVYCGTHGGSEPEIQALTSYIKEQNISVYFGFHSAGRDVMGSADDLAQKLAKAFSKATGYRLFKRSELDELHQTGTTTE